MHRYCMTRCERAAQSKINYPRPFNIYIAATLRCAKRNISASHNRKQMCGNKGVAIAINEGHQRLIVFPFLSKYAPKKHLIKRGKFDIHCQMYYYYQGCHRAYCLRFNFARLLYCYYISLLNFNGPSAMFTGRIRQ